MDTSSLIEAVRRHLPEGAAPDPVRLRAAVEERLPDPRRRRGVRHRLVCVLPVLVAGVACGGRGPLAIAQLAAGRDQEVLAGHGCRRNPRTGQLEAPSASTPDRLPRLLDADAFEAALTAAMADAALDPRVTAAVAERRAARRKEKEASRKRRKPPAAGTLCQVRGDGWFRAAPGHPRPGPQVTGDPGHLPARPAASADGKERKGARTGGKKKVHMLAVVTHGLGAVISQDRVAKSGKANEVTHFKPVLEPLNLDDVLIVADAMQTTRENARFLREDKHAHYLFPVLGNQPGPCAALDALGWENAPAAAATGEIGRGRIETRTLRVLPAPAGTGFRDARLAVLAERYVTARKNGQRVMRNCEAVLYITSLTPDGTTPEDLLAHIRGHWTAEHAHWLRDAVWGEGKSLIRAGNAPQVWSAITNLVITLFRIHGVTSYTEETRRNIQNPARALQLLALSPG